jgi:hypothetical protein
MKQSIPFQTCRQTVRQVFRWPVRRTSIKHAGFVVILAILGASQLGGFAAQASAASTSNSGMPDWVAPSATAVRRLGPVATTQTSSGFYHNTDCDLLTYRLVGSSTMVSGCFIDTAFGLFDSDAGVAIFHGTDEGVRLLANAPHELLVAWPKALDLLSLAVNVGGTSGGTYVNLYKNPLTALQDQRNYLGQLTSKQFVTPPDVHLTQPDGQPLIIIPESLAFADGGSWMVAQTTSGLFIRVNLATLAVTVFGSGDGNYQTGAGFPHLNMAISSDGRFVSTANDGGSIFAPTFTVYDLAPCDATGGSFTTPSCQSHSYEALLQQQINGLQSIDKLRFVNEGLLSFEATSSNPTKSGVYELAPTASITSLTDYIGLGDSYTSGEGAFNYLAGTDTTDNMCHLSRNSYPLLLTQDLFSSTGGHSVACSGASISDVGSTSDNYRGQVKDIPSLQDLRQSQPSLLESIQSNFTPGYIAQQHFVQQWQPGITTVSVGGDDIGFGDIVQNCVEPHITLHLSDETCYDTYEDRLELQQLIDRTVPRWTTLYKQLQRESPSTRLYAIGYPQTVDDRGDCALNVHLNRNELEFIETLTDYLNQDIQKAAVAASVPYVDVSQALVGHRLCETASYSVAVNGLTAGTDAGLLGVNLFGKESYHPNALGQSLIEQAILQKTHNLTDLLSTNTGTNTNGTDGTPLTTLSLLDAAASGRTVNTLVPDDNLTKGVGQSGANMQITASGTTDGLQPQTTYTINLDGPSGSVLGTITSDNTGSISTTVTIPPNSNPGGHTIDIIGTNQSGDPVDVTQPIYLPSSATDSDGDGIDDPLDSCPGVVNSGQDIDQDGIDDACDSLIGAAGSGSGSGPGTGVPDAENQTDNSEQATGGDSSTTGLDTTSTGTSGNNSNTAQDNSSSGSSRTAPSSGTTPGDSDNNTANTPPSTTTDSGDSPGTGSSSSSDPGSETASGTDSNNPANPTNDASSTGDTSNRATSGDTDSDIAENSPAPGGSSPTSSTTTSASDSAATSSTPSTDGSNLATATPMASDSGPQGDGKPQSKIAPPSPQGRANIATHVLGTATTPVTRMSDSALRQPASTTGRAGHPISGSTIVHIDWLPWFVLLILPWLLLLLLILYLWHTTRRTKYVAHGYVKPGQTDKTSQESQKRLPKSAISTTISP